MNNSMTKRKSDPSTSGRQARVRQEPPAAEPMETDPIDTLDDADIYADEEGGTQIGDIYIPPPIPAHCSTESKGPRLIITKIVNVDFKSYAGTVVLGPFHHCFTSIIGPNGSGKSNVIDSMLFVFGYRANKIRCKKISTLIHMSKKYPNVRRCSVAVHFQQINDIPGSEECERIANTEIVVERTAHHDNSSYYAINGQRAQFKDVAALLKRHQIDLDHNRFLILQGEVESISMMKPKGPTPNECGMLEYLEDIVGTTRYIKPLQLMTERVDQLSELRSEKHNRVKLAEREMQDLEEPYKAAIKYLRKENENTRTKNLRIQKYLSEKHKKLEEYTKQHEEAASVLKAHDDEASKIVCEREEKQKLIKDELAQVEQLIQQKDTLEKSLSKANTKYSATQTKMELVNNERKKHKTQIEKLTKDLEELRKLPEKSQAEIAECQQKLEKLQKTKQQLEAELAENRSEVLEQTKPLIEQREKLEGELLELRKAVEEAKSALHLSESELKIVKSEEIAEARKYESLKSAYEEYKSSFEEKQANMQALQKKMPESRKLIESKTQEARKLQQEERVLETKLDELRAEINEATSNIQRQTSRDSAINCIMRLKTEGRLPGVLGRLGDLGGIDERYDVAVSTAISRLDNMVVDTVDTAQQCINALKQHNAGRANFIALEKIRHYVAEPMQLPRDVRRLYDLVKVEDERVSTAFYFAMGDTLVTENMNRAKDVAYGGRTRQRVVTLDGNLIEKAGTLSGGGRSKIRGRMGANVRTKTGRAADSSMISEHRLEEMKEQAMQLQSRINYCQEQQGKIEREVQELEYALRRESAEFDRLQADIDSIKSQLPRTQKNLEMQRKRMEQTTSDSAKVKPLESKIQKQTTALQAAQAAADKVSKKVDEAAAEIAQLRGEKLVTLEKKLKSQQTQIDKLNGNVKKLKMDLKTSEHNIPKAEANIEALTADIKKAEEDLSKMRDDREQYKQQITEVEAQLVEAKQAIESAKKQTSSARKEVEELQKNEAELRNKRLQLDNELQTITSKLNDVKSQIPHWRNQLKPLRLNDIPDETEPQEPLKTYTEEELATYTLQDIQYKESVEEEELKKKPNLGLIQEYIDKRKSYLDRATQLEEITSKRNEMRLKYDEVRKRRYAEFMESFHIITRKLKEMYQMITQGGDAELELVDSLDPFTEGVSFSVRPPKKTWKNISNLSGGEKTLSSLALVFALHYYKPSPLYFMDEIDAALDFKNVSIVAHYIKERTKNAQFIIISLRTNMFELSDYLVGIYKPGECTASVTMKNPENIDQWIKSDFPKEQSDALFDAIRSNDAQAEQSQQATDVEMRQETNVSAMDAAEEAPLAEIEQNLQRDESIIATEPEQSQQQQQSVVGDMTFEPASGNTANGSALEESDAASTANDEVFKKPTTPKKL